MACWGINAEMGRENTVNEERQGLPGGYVSEYGPYGKAWLVNSSKGSRLLGKTYAVERGGELLVWS